MIINSKIVGLFIFYQTVKVQKCLNSKKVWIGHFITY